VRTGGRGDPPHLHGPRRHPGGLRPAAHARRVRRRHGPGDRQRRRGHARAPRRGWSTEGGADRGARRLDLPLRRAHGEGRGRGQGSAMASRRWSAAGASGGHSGRERPRRCFGRGSAASSSRPPPRWRSAWPGPRWWPRAERAVHAELGDQVLFNPEDRYPSTPPRRARRGPLRRRRPRAGHRAGGGHRQVLMMAWMNAETLRMSLERAAPCSGAGRARRCGARATPRATASSSARPSTTATATPAVRRRAGGQGRLPHRRVLLLLPGLRRDRRRAPERLTVPAERGVPGAGPPTTPSCRCGASCWPT
jgi:hypothetical protein